MKIKLDEPTIPNDIRQKIRNLRVLLNQADNLRAEILAWYTTELKSYDYRAEAEQELFDPGTETTVEGISELAIMEALSELQIFNEVRKKNMRWNLFAIKFEAVILSFVQVLCKRLSRWFD